VKRITVVGVLVKDQGEALKFYRDKLGFVLVEDLPFGDMRWITLRAPEDEAVRISLDLAESEADRRLVGKQCGSKPFLGLMTDDCMADFRRLSHAGVKFHGEPDEQPYGTGVTLEDLYGNRIYLNQEPQGGR